MSAQVLAVPVALGAAACYGVASACQQRAAYLGDEPSSVRLRTIAGLPAHPLWLLGLLLDAVGLALNVLALGLGPVSVVQPLQVIGLLVALGLEDFWRRRAPGLRRALAASGVVAGVVLFLLAASPGSSGRTLSPDGVWVLGLVALAGMALLAVVSAASPSSARAAMLGVAAGGGFAATAVLIGSLSQLRRVEGWGSLLGHHGLAMLVAVVAVGAASIVANQAAFQVGRLAMALPSIHLVDPVLSVALGATLLAEHVRDSSADLALAAVALVVAAVGVVTLVRPPSGPAELPGALRDQ